MKNSSSTQHPVCVNPLKLLCKTSGIKNFKFHKGIVCKCEYFVREIQFNYFSGHYAPFHLGSIVKINSLTKKFGNNLLFVKYFCMYMYIILKMKTVTNKLDFILKCFVQCTFKCYNKLNFDVRKILRAKGGKGWNFVAFNA